MVKSVLNQAGIRYTALVVLGWVAFVSGFFVGRPQLKLPLLAIARVLP